MEDADETIVYSAYCDSFAAGWPKRQNQLESWMRRVRSDLVTPSIPRSTKDEDGEIQSLFVPVRPDLRLRGADLTHVCGQLKSRARQRLSKPKLHAERLQQKRKEEEDAHPGRTLIPLAPPGEGKKPDRQWEKPPAAGQEMAQWSSDAFRELTPEAYESARAKARKRRGHLERVHFSLDALPTYKPGDDKNWRTVRGPGDSDATGVPPSDRHCYCLLLELPGPGADGSPLYAEVRIRYPYARETVRASVKRGNVPKAYRGAAASVPIRVVLDRVRLVAERVITRLRAVRVDEGLRGWMVAFGLRLLNGVQSYFSPLSKKGTKLRTSDESHLVRSRVRDDRSPSLTNATSLFVRLGAGVGHARGRPLHVGTLLGLVWVGGVPPPPRRVQGRLARVL